ncbi:GNAT family N-acetyltransferase [Thalassobacillus sp. CUG 92003]|uniref:GNAT family N-acetyltransferase n=1 Tax=Thalassobacillus sp. CUG 92003 TaxID=2736641 RepID=UPI0015E6E72D|nr:GNAT family N-acetyltransferase [Thalassobacillus sp. CUG 92003]
MSDIKQGENRFYIGSESRVDAEIHFEETDDETMVIDHTFVDPSKREEGLGSKLVAKAVEHAREEGLKIDPVCSFARDTLEQTPDYHDVLKTDDE